ncbi:hypothetical protein PCE1_002614 [Barthelona sp. PCE]
MKFGAYIEKNLIPEWGDNYINYSHLKKLIKRIAKDIEALEIFEELDFHDRAKYVSNLSTETVFLEHLWEEALKVEDFYHKQINSVTDMTLKIEANIVQYKDPEVSNPASHRKLNKSIRKAIKTQYQLLDLITNFAVMNTTGFSKITKKHDKRARVPIRTAVMQKLESECRFSSRVEISPLQRRLEIAYASMFCDGDRNRAHKEIQHVDRTTQTQEGPIFNVGVSIGLLLSLLSFSLFVVYSCNIVLDVPISSLPLSNIAFAVFSFYFLYTIAWILWLADVYVWITNRVNFTFILELEASTVLSYWEYAHVALMQFCFLVGGFTSYLMSCAPDDHVLSIAWDPITVLRLFCVTVWLSHFFSAPIRGKDSFSLLFTTFTRCVCAPFRRVLLRDFFFADQMNSGVYFLSFLAQFIIVSTYDIWFSTDDLEKTLFSRIDTHIMFTCSILPAWSRLWQCVRRYKDTGDAFPHLANLGKYGCSLFFTTLTMITCNFVLRIIFGVIANSYALWWDFVMDWSVFKFKFRSFEINLANRRRIFSNSSYYCGVIIDIIIRSRFILTPIKHSGLYFVINIAEMTRRCIWNVFRLENEQISNTGRFRAVNSVPLLFKVDPTSILDVGETPFTVLKEDIKMAKRKEKIAGKMFAKMMGDVVTSDTASGNVELNIRSSKYLNNAINYKRQTPSPSDLEMMDMVDVIIDEDVDIAVDE